MNGRGEGAAGANHRVTGKAIGQAKDGGTCAEMNLLGVAAAEVRGRIGTVGDAVSLTAGTAGGLALDAAVVALPADDAAGPGDTIADSQRIAAPIVREAFANRLQAADGFMTEDNGKGNMELAEPKMDVGAANAGDFDADQRFTGRDFSKCRILTEFQGLFIRRKYGSFDSAHWLIGLCAVVEQELPFGELHLLEALLIAGGRVPAGLDKGKRVPTRSVLVAEGGGGGAQFWKDGVLSNAAEPVAGVPQVRLHAVKNPVPIAAFGGIQILSNGVALIEEAAVEPQAGEGGLGHGGVGEEIARRAAEPRGKSGIRIAGGDKRHEPAAVASERQQTLGFSTVLRGVPLHAKSHCARWTAMGMMEKCGGADWF